jgi:hypothetical protein
MKPIGELVKEHFQMQRKIYEIAARQTLILSYDEKHPPEKREKYKTQSEACAGIAEECKKVVEAMEKKEPDGLQAPGS